MNKTGIAVPTSAKSTAVVRPTQLAHVVFYTNQLATMAKWYETVLGAELTFGNERIAFLTFDAEHHRIALVGIEGYSPKPSAKTVGFYHTAFTYGSLASLIATYERLMSCDIAPVRTINHGPTVSFYYADPDGNLIELQVDAFPDAASAKQWMQGPAFSRNPIGIELNMDDYLAAFHSGTPEAVLLKRADDH